MQEHLVGPMTHDEAHRRMAIEGYLLNELAPEERDAFEEHYFSCAECALELQMTAAFLDQVKAELPHMQFASGTAPASNPGQSPRAHWWSGWNPVWVPALVCLLLVSVLLNVGQQRSMVRAAAAFQSPHLLPSLSLLRSNARAGSLPVLRASAKEPLLLYVDIPGDSGYSSYRAALYTPLGGREWSLNIPASAVTDTVPLQLSPPRQGSGVYTLRIEGLSAENTSPATVEELPFRLQIQP